MNLKPSLFERNWVKDHEDAAKIQQWVTIVQSSFTDKINCAQKIKPICCQTHRINCWWQEAENRSEDRKLSNFKPPFVWKKSQYRPWRYSKKFSSE